MEDGQRLVQGTADNNPVKRYFGDPRGQRGHLTPGSLQVTEIWGTPP